MPCTCFIYLLTAVCLLHAVRMHDIFSSCRKDNGASLSGLGMVTSWGLAVLVAIYTIIALLQARHGQRKGGISLVALTNWCALFTVGVVTATTVRERSGREGERE